MVKPVKIERCKICGELSKVYKWWTKSSSGKKYHYLKFVHNNGITHYYNITKESPLNESINFRQYIELFVKYNLKDRKMRFIEMKRSIEKEYNVKINNQSFWRAINRMIKFNELQRTEENGKIYYMKGSGESNIGLYIIDEIYFTLDLDNMILSTTMKVFNNSNRIQTTLPVLIPDGNFKGDKESLINSFDLYGRIDASSFKVIFSIGDETGISVDLNKPLKSYERNLLHLEIRLKTEEKYRSFTIPLDAKIVNIYILSNKKNEIKSKKISLDYSKETQPDSIAIDRNKDGKWIYNFVYSQVRAKEMIIIETI